MSTITIPNRPFASEIITGLMLPDGIFETSLGRQRINAHFSNNGATSVAGARVYVESASHPGIVVVPTTHTLSALAGGASRVLTWEADLTAVAPGTHRISFIVETATDRTRIIKKIFVTTVQFDESTLTFSAITPEGQLKVRFDDLVPPVNLNCCPGRLSDPRDNKKLAYMLNHVGRLFEGHKADFRFCPPGYLPLNLEATFLPNPPYAGQYGDLPFEDPWWKVVLCIIAVILLIAAAIAAAEEGGTIIVSTGGGGGSSDPNDPGACCGTTASGGSSSYLVAGLVAAAAAAATAACLSDVRDPFRRGEDHTQPADGEITVSESVKMKYRYPEPVALGRPFAAGLEWKYTRATTGGTYTHSDKDLSTNVHVLSRYEIQAPEVVFPSKKEPFLVKASFFDGDGKQLRGSELFVQCFLLGSNNQFVRLVLQDDGIKPDEKPTDGIYTAQHYFDRSKDGGLWRYFVIAQDINDARPDMEPEEAAKIIGGMVRTHQLTIVFDANECPLVPDGFVNVVV